MRKFTKQQVDYICANLDFWYMQAWQNERKVRKIVCGLEKYEALEDEEDEYDINPNTKPWETEPDFLEFVDESTGYKCYIMRHPELKHLCGYVELPKEHKLYGETDKFDNKFLNLDVHGGVTYAGRREFKQQNDIADYVVGFDCAHAGDYCPYYFPIMGGYE